MDMDMDMDMCLDMDMDMDMGMDMDMCLVHFSRSAAGRAAAGGKEVGYARQQVGRAPQQRSTISHDDKRPRGQSDLGAGRAPCREMRSRALRCSAIRTAFGARCCGICLRTKVRPCTPLPPLARALHFPHATVAAVRTCCGQPREAPAKRHARSAAPKAHQPRGARWFAAARSALLAAARSALLARAASTAPCPPLPAPSAIRPQRACAAGSDERDRSALSHPVVDLNLVARARPSSR